jgi:amidohydrolase
MTAVHDDAVALAPDLVELRRALHREPEIGLQLPRTQEKVLAALAGLPLEQVSTGRELTSVTAVLRGGLPGPTVLLRGDMDALPVTEQTGVPYASQVDGAMHACGHDLHTAILVGAARLLSARQAELPGSVVFMFQPGEEGDGGAKLMIGEGVLEASGERAVAAYGLHVSSSELPCGLFAGRPGAMLAAADTLEVTVRGRGGHASRPALAADPIPVAAEIVTALQVLVTRQFDVFDPVVITVGSIHAGTAENIIPDYAELGATIRTFSPGARARVRDASVRLAEGIAAAHGLTADAVFTDGYPVTMNDPAELAFTTSVIDDALGGGRCVLAPNPITGAEDFAFVLEQVPGAFVFLGACPPGTDPSAAAYNHSPRAVFDDRVLPDGAELLAELALRRLARG